MAEVGGEIDRLRDSNKILCAALDAFREHYDLLAKHGQELQAEIERLKNQVTQLEGCLELSGAALQADGSLLIKTAKFNAMHRCAEHRKQDYKQQDLEHCMICVRAEIDRLKEAWWAEKPP